MNSTPTGGPATPSSEGDGPVEGPPAEAAVAVPAQRSGPHPLPRRARQGGDPRVAGPDSDPGRDPDGRRYAAADAATLDRLLSGLRDI
jgi:hypothetical protein